MSIRQPCPDCGDRRSLYVGTDGNGRTFDDWKPCENPNCKPAEATMTARTNPARRLNDDERAKVMEVLRAHPDLNDRQVAEVLAREHGISITGSAIGITYRPRLETNGNGHAPEPKRGRRSVEQAALKTEPPKNGNGNSGPARAVLVEALRTYAGHLAECSIHEDDARACTCGFGESPLDAALREARHLAAAAMGKPFWEVEISVK